MKGDVNKDEPKPNNDEVNQLKEEKLKKENKDLQNKLNDKKDTGATPIPLNQDESEKLKEENK